MLTLCSLAARSHETKTDVQKIELYFTRYSSSKESYIKTHRSGHEYCPLSLIPRLLHCVNDLCFMNGHPLPVSNMRSSNRSLFGLTWTYQSEVTDSEAIINHLHYQRNVGHWHSLTPLGSIWFYSLDSDQNVWLHALEFLFRNDLHGLQIAHKVRPVY